MSRYQRTRGEHGSGIYDTAGERVVVPNGRDTEYGVGVTLDALRGQERLQEAYVKAVKAHRQEYAEVLRLKTNPNPRAFGQAWQAYMTNVHATAKAMAG